MTPAQKFSKLIDDIKGPFNDLEDCISGLMLYADQNASDEEKQQFLDWLGGRPMFGTLYSVNTTPFDHFECAEGKTWDDMEEFFESAIA